MKKFFKIVFSGLCALVIGLNVFGLFNTNTTAFAQSNSNMDSTSNELTSYDYLNHFYDYQFVGSSDSIPNPNNILCFDYLSTYYQDSSNNFYRLLGNTFTSVTVPSTLTNFSQLRFLSGIPFYGVNPTGYYFNAYRLSVDLSTNNLISTSFLFKTNSLSTTAARAFDSIWFTANINHNTITYYYDTTSSTLFSLDITTFETNGTTYYQLSVSLTDVTIPFNNFSISRFAYINDVVYYFNPVDTYGETVDVYYFDGSTFTLITQLGFDFNDTTYNIVDSVWFDGKYYYINNYKITSDTTTFTLERVSFIPYGYTGSAFPGQTYYFGSTIWSNGLNVFSSGYVLYNNLYYTAFDAGYADGYEVAYDIGYADGVAAGGSGSSYEDGYNDGYNAGVTAGSSTSYNAGYNAGYNQGTTAGYNNGYREGYDQGVINGTNTGYNQGLDAGYNNGYSDGYNNGVDVGYTDGYNEGVESANDYTFLSLIGATIDAPIKAFTGLFNFEIFGTNISTLLLALFTASIIIVIVKISLGGK